MLEPFTIAVNYSPPSEFVSGLPRLNVRSEETLFIEGSYSDRLYLVDSGIVVVTKLSPTRDILIALRGRGWLLGAAAVLCGTQHAATARALTASCVRVLSRARFEELRRGEPNFEDWLGRMLAQDARLQLERFAMLLGACCQVRLEHLLKELLSERGGARPDGSIRLDLPLTVTRLADLTSVSREQMSRTISKLEEQNVVHRSKGWLVVPRESRLLTAFGGPGSAWERSCVGSLSEPPD